MAGGETLSFIRVWSGCQFQAVRIGAEMSCADRKCSLGGGGKFVASHRNRDLTVIVETHGAGYF